MRGQWLAMEHSRLHAVEAWPDSPRREAVLASIRSKIGSLEQADSSECPICQERSASRLIEIRLGPVVQDAPIHVAA